MPLDDFGSNVLRFLRASNIFRPEEDNLSRYRTPPFVEERRPRLTMDFRLGEDERMPRPTGSIVSEEVDDWDPAARMRELYAPETRATDKYLEALEGMPVRNKPGLLRKIVAGVSAFGTKPVQNVEQVLYGPYRRQMEDWTAKVGPLGEAASLERQQNANLRMIANQILSQEMSDRRLLSAEERARATLGRQTERDRVLREQGEARIRQGEERLTQAEARIKQAGERLKIARAVARGGQFEVDDAGNANIVFKDGSTVPVDMQYLSREEIEGLRAETAASVTRAREGAKRDRIVERVIEDPDTPGKFIRARVNLDTGDVEPLSVKPRKEGARGEAAAPPTTELEKSRGVAAKALNIKNSNPKWNKWITIKGNAVEITRPGIFSGPSQQEYDQIYKQIFGGPPTGPGVQTGRGAPPPTRRPAGAPPAGRVRVIGPNGETGTVTEEDSRRLPLGWRKE